MAINMSVKSYEKLSNRKHNPLHAGKCYILLVFHRKVIGGRRCTASVPFKKSIILLNELFNLSLTPY